MTTLLGRGSETERFGIAFAVLGFALMAEGTSLARASMQIAGAARRAGRRMLAQLSDEDPTVRTVFAEDATAVIGVLVASGGILAHALTGNARWEGAAALVIAALLAFIAYQLGRDAKDLLIGESASPALRLAAHEFLVAQPEIDTVLAVLTMRLGLDSTLIAVRVDLFDGLDSDGVEAVSGRIKAALTERFPVFDQVFLDITDATDDDRAKAEQRLAALTRSVRTSTDSPDGTHG